MVPCAEHQRLSQDLGCRLGSFVVSGSALLGKRGFMEVTLTEHDRLDFVLKKFRRQITKAGLFQDMKKKRFYESPATRRRRKDKAAARRKVKNARRREHY
jgi:small subunit ribosomal protein S21